MTTEEIIEYSKNFRMGLFGNKKGDGLCFAVSAPLCGALKFMGVNCRLGHFHVEGFDSFEEHYAIVVRETELLDPTYDQIKAGNPQMFYGKIPENYIEI